jgi:phosphoglycerate dehydrogenase-like enzyme
MAERFGDEIRAVAGDVELVVLGSDGAYDGDPSGAEVFFFSIDLSFDEPAMAEAMQLMGQDSVRWVQGPGAGVDHPIWSRILDRGGRLTNASGIHAEPIAQYILTYVLHWERQVVRHQAQQAAREWQIILSGDLTAKTLGIVGLGGIGSATARVARAFGMRVLALRRSDREDPNVDRHLKSDELHALLAESHYVVLCCPLSEETRHLIGAREIEAMRDDAVLINVARGGVVDESALIPALEAGTIRGASLDVTEVEPLPPDSPLWSLERCVLTPHDAGYSPLADERLGRLFLENFRLYCEGAEMLRNEIRP